MNLIVLFVLLLQVLTALCARCHMSGGRNGYCVRRNDCNTDNESLSLTSCHGTPLYCCPADSLTVDLQLALSSAALEFKFPTDCGWTPMYPREQIFGGEVIQPDEYSWIASLRYGYEAVNGCGGSVINSRYVLTAAHCTEGLTSVRLGAFDEKGNICDYGTQNCTHYQEFGIEQIILHKYSYNLTYSVNDIALIRLDKPIEFTKNLKPICLPFGGNVAAEPEVGSSLTISGWGYTMEKIEIVAKRAAFITLQDSEKCKEQFDVDETHLCAVEDGRTTCRGDSGGPLMNQFARRRMFLEGIVSYGISNCTDTRFPSVFTRVRSYGQWLDDKMDM